MAAKVQPKHRGSIFISYSRRDSLAADAIASFLVEGGFDVLIDREDTAAFEPWWERLRTLIRQADTVIFLVSPHSAASDICAAEIDFAAGLGKRLAPVVIGRVEPATLPKSVQALQFVFMDDPDGWQAASRDLLDGLTVNLPWVRQHTEISLAADAWVNSARKSGLLLRSPKLQDAERWRDARPDDAPAVSALQADFIRASRKGLRRRVVTRTVAATALSFFIGSNVVLGVGLAFFPEFRTDVVATIQDMIEDEGLVPDNLRLARANDRVASALSAYRADPQIATHAPRIAEAYANLAGLDYELAGRYSRSGYWQHAYEWAKKASEATPDDAPLERARLDAAYYALFEAGANGDSQRQAAAFDDIVRLVEDHLPNDARSYSLLTSAYSGMALFPRGRQGSRPSVSGLSALRP